MATLGDHIRKRRMDLGLFQRQAAEQLGCNESTVHLWETNQTTPELRFMPAIIRFLGHNPLPDAATWPELLVRYRRTNGLSQRELAELFDIDPATIGHWEQGLHRPVKRYHAALEAFLRGQELKPDGFQVRKRRARARKCSL